jgi:hypothetical protein
MSTIQPVILVGVFWDTDCQRVFTYSSLHTSSSSVAYSILKREDDQTNAVLVVDFSKNYLCKHSHAVQSFHFGASNNQISLHTSVVYVKGKPTSFCSLFESTMHELAAIWVH